MNEHDERRLVAEKLGQRLRARRDVALVALGDALITAAAGETVGQLAPDAKGEQTVFELQTVGRVAAFAIEGSYPNWLSREEARVDKVGHALYALHAPNGVRQRNEAMGLAAAVLRVGGG